MKLNRASVSLLSVLPLYLFSVVQAVGFPGYSYGQYYSPVKQLSRSTPYQGDSYGQNFRLPSGGHVHVTDNHQYEHKRDQDHVINYDRNHDHNQNQNQNQNSDQDHRKTTMSGYNEEKESDKGIQGDSLGIIGADDQGIIGGNDMPIEYRPERHMASSSSRNKFGFSQDAESYRPMWRSWARTFKQRNMYCRSEGEDCRSINCCQNHKCIYYRNANRPYVCEKQSSSL